MKENAFFWDTIQLGSIHAHFYLENNFSTLILPENIDSGHPPTFGIYLALVWKFFGKSLPVSHFAMLPFLWGIIFYGNELGKYFFQNSLFRLGLLGLILLDPCFAGQAILVSPDVVVVLFLLMSLVGIFQKKPWLLAIGIIGLCLLSMRGIMVAAAIFVFDFLNTFFILKKKIKVKTIFVNALPYTVGVGLGLAFLLYHYVETGWMGYHENSPWAPAFEKVDVAGGLRNVAILGWRLLDFGRIFLWVIILFSGIQILKNKELFDTQLKQIICLFLSLMFFLTPALIIHKMLLGHRYVLPIYLIIDLLTVYLIFITIKTRKWKIIFFTFAFLGLSTGNLWIYPKKIAQGWDSTLAVLPYFELRKEMMTFIRGQEIPLEKIGSAFPNVVPIKYIDLENSMEQFEVKNFQQQDYIFYSNVYNDFTDEEIDELVSDWQVVKKLERHRICIILYRKKQ